MPSMAEEAEAEVGTILVLLGLVVVVYSVRAAVVQAGLTSTILQAELAELGGPILLAVEVLEVAAVGQRQQWEPPIHSDVAMAAAVVRGVVIMLAQPVASLAAAAAAVVAMVAAGVQEVLEPRELYASGPGKK